MSIVASSQPSRFAADSVDAPDTKEIDIKDVTISIAGHEVLDHAHLKIKEGGRYVLVGRNGCGKSTLLRAMADGLIPGIPWTLRVLLLGQTIISSDVYEDDGVDGNLKRQDMSVLQHVVTSDRKREKALHELRMLEKPLEGQDPQTALFAFRQLQVERKRLRLLELRLIASRRSGARGAKARKALNDGEAALEAAEKALDNVAKDISGEGPHVEKEMREAVEVLEEIRATLESMDSNNTEPLSRRVLKGLGFSDEMIVQPFSQLSGGWRTRCFLASALVQKTDVLCLDEPTNFLDLPAVLWLQTYLRETLSENTSLVVVTHDRDFADAVGDDLILIRTVGPLTRKLEPFKGNLTTWEKEKRKKILYLSKMKDALDKKKEKLEMSISENVKAAKKSGDDKRLKQAASKQRKLDERMGMERNEKGHKFKLNRDAPGFFLSSRGNIDIPELEPEVKIVFPKAEDRPKTITGSMLSLEKVSVRYKGATKEALKDVSLVVHPGDRVGIVGLNGSGKSTLIKVLTGALPTSKGTVQRNPRAKLGYYSQHAVESITSAGLSDPNLTCLSYLSSSAEAGTTEQDIRSCLAGVGLKGRMVTDVAVKHLSGGQKVRLAIAKMVQKCPDCLVLDEVSTHLDADTIVALAEALADWDGAVVLVSHDRWMIRYVIEGERDIVEDDEEEDIAEEHIKIGTVYRLKDGEIVKLDGGMRQYEEIMVKKARKAG